MDDKFDRLPKGEDVGVKLRRSMPGSELSGKGYLSDVDADCFEKGYEKYDGPSTMDQVEMQKPRLRGEW